MKKNYPIPISLLVEGRGSEKSRPKKKKKKENEEIRYAKARPLTRTLALYIPHTRVPPWEERERGRNAARRCKFYRPDKRANL